MDKYSISKNVRDGTVVRLRGDKFIVCSGRYKAFGVYQAASQRVLLTLSGEVKTVMTPAGVQTYGPAHVILDEGGKAHVREARNHS